MNINALYIGNNGKNDHYFKQLSNNNNYDCDFTLVVIFLIDLIGWGQNFWFLVAPLQTTWSDPRCSYCIICRKVSIYTNVHYKVICYLWPNIDQLGRSWLHFRNDKWIAYFSTLKLFAFSPWDSPNKYDIYLLSCI